MIKIKLESKKKQKLFLGPAYSFLTVEAMIQLMIYDTF